MATLSKPLISAAALASAAAVAVATPAIVPSVGAPTPGALSKAAYELATFSDVLSIPPVVWTDILFGNDSWGNTLSPTKYGPEWAKPTDALGQAYYVNPWAGFCNGKCRLSGIGGVAYMVADALVNGNGKGYDDYENWPIGIVNYFFEPISAFVLGPGNSPTVQFDWNGLSAASWYALAGTIAQVAPELQVPLAGAFWGPQNVSVFYTLGLTVAAALVDQVPVVGPVTANTILAYLGDLPIAGTSDYYQYGLSGALNYWIDLATGAVPFPTAAVAAAAAVEAPASAAAATVVNDAPVAPSEAPAPAVAADAPVAPSEAPAPAVAADAPVAPSEAPAPAVAADAAAAGDVAESAPAADTESATPAAGDATAADDAAAADDAVAADEAEAADDAVAADEAEAADDAVAADEAEAADDAKAGDPSDSAPADDAPAKASDNGAAEKGGAAASSSASGAGAAGSDSADSAK